MLGLATTRELFQELEARLMHAPETQPMQHAISYARTSWDSFPEGKAVLDYRTVDADH